MKKIYKCGHCKYEGPAYGIPFIGSNSGVSAPFCPRCNMNNKLELVPDPCCPETEKKD